MAGRYLRVKCKCGNEQVLFSNATSRIDCSKCNDVLAEPKGGKANILGKVLGELG